MLPPDGDVINETPATMWPFVMIGEDILGFHFIESVGQHQAEVRTKVKQMQAIVICQPLSTSIGPKHKVIIAAVFGVDVSIEIT